MAGFGDGWGCRGNLIGPFALVGPPGAWPGEGMGSKAMFALSFLTGGWAMACLAFYNQMVRDHAGIVSLPRVRLTNHDTGPDRAEEGGVRVNTINLRTKFCTLVCESCPRYQIKQGLTAKAVGPFSLVACRCSHG